MTTRTKICLKSPFVHFHQSRTKMNMLLIIFRDFLFLSLPYTLNHTTEFLTWLASFLCLCLIKDLFYFIYMWACVCAWGLCLYLFLCLYVNVIVCIQAERRGYWLMAPQELELPWIVSYLIWVFEIKFKFSAWAASRLNNWGVSLISFTWYTISNIHLWYLKMSPTLFFS